MRKAAGVMISLAVLLSLDALLPRAGWMPAPLVTKSVLEARWWPASPPESKPDEVATTGVDEEAEEAVPPPPRKLPEPVKPTVVVASAPTPAPAPAKPVAPAPEKPAVAKAVVAHVKSFVAPPSAGWDDFRQRLDELEAGKRTKVRVIQLGDSEIAGDWVSRTVRHAFSQRWGEGGPGFALALAPWPWYAREGFKHEDPTGFTVKSFVFGSTTDGNYGPGGVAFDSSRKGASATLQIESPPPACEISFHYATMPDGGEIDIFADDRKLDHVTTAGPERGPAVKRYTLDACPSRLTATVVTSAKARLFGWTVESSTPGVVWSSLGVVSASAGHLRHYGTEQLVKALDELRPDLIVLSYGLNIVHTGVPPASSERGTFESILADLRMGMKDARCLAVSPYPVVVSQDGELSPSGAVAILAKYQRQAAGDAGCAFLDRELLAGGPQSGLKWLESKPRLLSGDYVHLTAAGSEHVGRQMAS
jgi:hypothetical protein